MRFTFFGGKGGVGKTTCAAAAAVRAAREGARVLVVSTDPAHSLGDALAAALGPEPTRAGAVHAAQIDADRALTAWLDEREQAFRTIASRGTYLADVDIDRLLSLSLPGVDELVGLVEVLRVARTQPFDRVVVDTAPTGHTLRLLEMPAALRKLAEVLDDMQAKHRFLTASLVGAWRPDAADRVIADLERESDALRAMLVRASFTWVTLAEELAQDEAERAVASVEALGLRVRTVVVNRVSGEPDRPCALCTPRAEVEAACLERVRRAFASRRVLVVPAVIREPRGEGALAALAGAVRPLERAPARATRARVRGRGVDGAAARSSRAPEVPIAASVKLVLFGGKGGVGKTSAAAAYALARAEGGGRPRVLLMSTDPAHSLADALGQPIGDEAVTVSGAPDTLLVREIDAKRAFEGERARYQRAIDDVFSTIFRGGMDAAYDRAVMKDLVDLAPPGIDELVALVSLVDAIVPARGEPAHDLVVVDTAPTGHTLRLLELPQHALEWTHAIMSILLEYRRVIGLGPLASDLTALARRLKAFSQLLVDPARAAFVAVSRPAELPRVETERLAARLADLGVPLAAVLANAVTTPGCARCSAAADAEAREIAALAAIGAPLVRAPAVFPPPRGARSLREWCAEWRRAA